jgi:hypothetical protein
LKQTVDSVTGMLYQRANIPLEVPFSEFLFDLAKEDEVQDEQQEETKKRFKILFLFLIYVCG